MSPIHLNTTHRIFLLIVGLVLLAAMVLGMRVDLDSLKHQMLDTGPLTSLLFIVVATSLMSVCVPKTAVSLTAGAMFGVAQGLVVLVIVAILAATLNYWIGYVWIGRQRLSRNLQDDCESDTFLSAVVDVAADAGWCLHALIRLSPVPTMLISYSMGAIGARFAPYLGAAALATLPQVLWVHSGARALQVASVESGPTQWVGLAVSLGVAVVVTIVISHEARRQLRTNVSLLKESNR